MDMIPTNLWGLSQKMGGLVFFPPLFVQEEVIISLIEYTKCSALCPECDITIQQDKQGRSPLGKCSIIYPSHGASLSAVIQSFNSCSLQAGRLLTVHGWLAWVWHFYFIYSFILHDWSYQPPVLWREEKSLQLKLWWSYLSKFALLSDSWLQLYISYVRLLWSI